MNIAIVGASGAVGQELLKVLHEQDFPVSSLRLFGSKRSAGNKYEFRGKEYVVEELTHDSDFTGVDIAFTSAGASTSKEYADVITRHGTVMIDNSSAFRMDPDVPLVVPEVNPQDAFHRPRNIIGNPNCTTIQMVVALKPINDLSPIRKVHVSTYQAASGAGAAAMKELQRQFEQLVKGEAPSIEKFPYQLAYNLIPQVDVFMENGYTKEEMKMFNETRKILHSDKISVSATCVRVPVLRAHSEAIWVETEQPLELPAVREALASAPGLVLVDPSVGTSFHDVSDDTHSNTPTLSEAPHLAERNTQRSATLPYPMPLDVSGADPVYVGRLRQDLADPRGLSFWVVGDQIKKGAALNAVQIARLLL